MAQQFEQELNKSLPIAIQPDGSVVYKTFYIKQQANGNWGVHHIKTHDLVEQYFLRSCALMAAKAYDKVNIERFIEIKRLDNRYWAHHADYEIFKTNIKKAKDFNRYLILLNKLEHSETQLKHYREEISRMFKGSFV